MVMLFQHNAKMERQIELYLRRLVRVHPRDSSGPIWLVVRYDGTILDWSMNKGWATVIMNKRKKQMDDCDLQKRERIGV
jgi:hypothetical protein